MHPIFPFKLLVAHNQGITLFYILIIYHCKIPDIVLEYFVAVLSNLEISMVMMGKFAITCSFTITYVFTAELLPTAVRNVGLGVGSMAARLGGIAAPYAGLLVGSKLLIFYYISHSKCYVIKPAT